MEKKLGSTKDVPPFGLDQIYRASGIGKLCPREEVLRVIYNVIRTERYRA